MKNRIGGGKALIFSLLISSFSIAQNQSNLIDTTGNVGVGTLSPSHKLTVNGNMRVDSSFTARDSAVFEKRIRVKGDVVIHGKTIMKGDGVAKQDFRVNQTLRVDDLGRFKNKVVIDSLLKVDGDVRTFGTNNYFGTSRFHNDVKLINLNDPTGQNQEGFMMLNGNGKVERKDIIDLDTINANQYVLTIDENGKIKKTGLLGIMNIGPACEGLGPAGGPYQDVIPNWTREPGIIWTGEPCEAKVGIGTDDPLFNLDVVGASRTKNLIINTSTNSNLSPLVVKYSNNDIFRVESSGLVRAREIKVDLDTWPDYVFEKEYNLMSTDELRSFIAKNKHLPNIPSAKEVEEDGVSLGEMNKKLLEKVEELTLYMLQQQEEIELLKSEMKAIKAEGGQ